MRLTKEEKIILKKLDKRWKYIARDNNGNLCLYEEPPFKSYLEKIWCVSDGYAWFVCHLNHLFQNIKWTDNEPLEFRNKKGEFIL